MSRARSRERALRDGQVTSCAQCLSAGGSCSPQNRASICCLRPDRPSQKIESVFSASPETTRREPRENGSPPLSRQPAGPGSLRIDDPVFISSAGFYAASLARCSAGMNSRFSRSTASSQATILRATRNMAKHAAIKPYRRPPSLSFASKAGSRTPAVRLVPRPGHAATSASSNKPLSSA